MTRALLLKPDRIWTNGSLSTGHVLVEGNRIATIGSVDAPRVVETVDLSGLTLLPGLMDLHSHLFLHPYNETVWDDQVLKEPEAYRTILAFRWH